MVTPTPAPRRPTISPVAACSSTLTLPLGTSHLYRRPRSIAHTNTPRSIESLIRETEENLHSTSGAKAAAGAAPPAFGSVLSASTNQGGGGSKADLRREVASIQNHVRCVAAAPLTRGSRLRPTPCAVRVRRSELDKRLDEQRQEMEEYFRKELEKQSTTMARQISEIRREAATSINSSAGDGESALSLTGKVSKLEQAVEVCQAHEADAEDRNARDKQELRSEMRTAQSAVFTHVSDVETNLKRQLQQADSNIRELRGQVRESIRATKEHVEELEEQSNQVLTQLKRSVVEHQQASDEHNMSAKRAESELSSTVSKVRRLERLVGLLEEAVQDAASSGGQMRPLAHYRAASEAPAPNAMSTEAVQRQLNSALETQMKHVEQQLSSMRDLTQNRIELESSRTAAACEKMMGSVSSQIAQERDARLEAQRELQRTGGQIDALRSQQEQAQAALRRQLADADAALSEESKLREELEKSVTTQLKMTALRLEEDVALKVSSDIAQLATEVARIKAPQASAAPSLSQRSAAQEPAAGGAVMQSAVARIEQLGSRLEAQERDSAEMQLQLRELGNGLDSVKEGGGTADSFEV